jgi:hypothetical protein
MPKKVKINDTENNTEEGECRNCGDTNPLKECENCSEAFCEDCLNKKGECENCGSSDTLPCENCDSEIEDEDDQNLCPDCDNIFCNEEDCWNEKKEKCVSCFDEETSDWEECSSCEKKFPPEYDMVECWKCEEEFCSDGCATTAKLNDRAINLCQDCYQKI